MKKTLLAATSLLALAAFGAQATEEAKTETTKEVVKTETTTEANPATGEVKKEEHKTEEHKKEEHK